MFLRGDRPLPLCCKCDDQYNLAYDHTAPLCVSWLHRDVRCPRQYTCEAEKAEKNKATTVSKQQSFEGTTVASSNLRTSGVFCASSCFVFFSRRVFSTLAHRTGVDARSPSSMAGRAVDIMPVQRMAAWAKRCQERSGTIGITAYAANIAELNF